MKKKLLLFLLLILPFNVLAYSNKLIVPGKTIGIEVHSKGVYVIDFYKVNNKNIAKDAGFMIGDIIKSINGKKINNINDLNSIINKIDTYNIIVDRNDKEFNIQLKPVKEDNIIKTGLYVKDEINGIGTLSYIDPTTKIFASLGHEILESSSLNKFKLNDGNIYNANINSINRSSNNDIGEIHASIMNKQLGTINKNEINGIYGKYTADLEEDNLVEIKNHNEIDLKEAYLKANLDNNVTDNYLIKIISLNDNDSVKNIYFEIIDKRLIDKTGGVIQGMSGSPIIQDNKVIGVVNYVVVDDVKRGYGIYIEKMLEEGDKLLKDN